MSTHLWGLVVDKYRRPKSSLFYMQILVVVDDLAECRHPPQQVANFYAIRALAAPQAHVCQLGL